MTFLQTHYDYPERVMNCTRHCPGFSFTRAFVGGMP